MRDAELTEKITGVHATSRGSRGAPRIHATLRRAGDRCGRPGRALVRRRHLHPDRRGPALPGHRRRHRLPPRRRPGHRRPPADRAGRRRTADHLPSAPARSAAHRRRHGRRLVAKRDQPRLQGTLGQYPVPLRHRAARERVGTGGTAPTRSSAHPAPAVPAPATPIRTTSAAAATSGSPERKTPPSFGSASRIWPTRDEADRRAAATGPSSARRADWPLTVIEATSNPVCHGGVRQRANTARGLIASLMLPGCREACRSALGDTKSRRRADL